MTLRFKFGRHTILLFAEPLTTFATIKSELLKTLHERYPEGLTRTDQDEKVTIPSDTAEIILGVPNDQYDNTKGWTELDTDAGGGIKETPKSLSLKDGGMIAFAFVPEGDDQQPDFHVEFSNVDELYPDEE